MVNVGQLTPLFISLFLGLLLLKDSQKWFYTLGSFLLFFKPTLGIMLAGNALSRGRKDFLLFMLAGTFSFGALFLQGRTGFEGLLEQGRGQVKAAYSVDHPNYPFTFEAMSNTQLQSVCALIHVGNSLYVIITVLLCILFVVAAVLFLKKKDNRALEVFAVLASLIFTYHKYYDLLLLIPFSFYFLNNSNILLKYVFGFLIIHLLLPYSLLKVAGIGNTVVNSLQFMNSILPLLLGFIMIFTLFEPMRQKETTQRENT